MGVFTIAYCGPAAVPQDLWSRWTLVIVATCALFTFTRVAG